MKECIASPVSTLAPVLTSCPVLVVVRSTDGGGTIYFAFISCRSSIGGGFDVIGSHNDVAKLIILVAMHVKRKTGETCVVLFARPPQVVFD